MCRCLGAQRHLMVMLFIILALSSLSAASLRPDIAPGQILVKLVPQEGKIRARWQNGVVSVGIPSIDRRIWKYEVHGVSPLFPHKSSELGDIYQLDFDDTFNPLEVAADFATDAHLLYAEPRYLQRLHEMPDDEFYLTGIQYYIDKIGCLEAWDLTHGDSLAIIAIVDTGVDWNHPDLFANIWVNPGEDLDGDGHIDNSDFNMIDDDGNGYVDDIIGWDFSGAGYPDWNPMEYDAIHGTHVAGCASAVTNNGVGVAGVGWNCSIMAIKATEDGEEGIKHGYEGILYAAENGADVINASWGHSGGGPSQFEQEIIDSAAAMGSIIISSAGNEPGVSPPDTCDIEYPAWYDHVVAVAATNQYDKATSWTFYGSWVDVAAPGQAIYNTWFNDSYAMLQGTSMSSPIVAGIAGLLKSIDADMTSDEFEAKMWHTSDDIYDINPRFTGWLGGGRANAHQAVLSLTDPGLVLEESLIDDSSGNGDGRPDPGEVVSWIVTLRNRPTWQAAQNLTVKVFTDDESVVFSQDSVAFVDIVPGESGDNAADPFQFSISSQAEAHWTTFYLQMEADGAIGDLLDSLRMLIGRPPVLIVDDDGGDDLEGSYQRGLEGMGVLYDCWDVAASGKVDADELMKYGVIIWLTGAEAESTLTPEDQSHLGDFLEAGHHLFLTGQNIGDDIGGSDFFRDYIHVTHLADSVSLDPPYLDGVEGDVIAMGDSLMLSGAEPQHSPGGVEAIQGGVEIYTYRAAPQYAAATRYQSPKGYQVVYFAFGYEGIRGTDEYTHGPVLLKRIMKWFDVETGFPGGSDDEALPRQCALSQNYPNPFNAETRIEYSFPPENGRQHTTLRIYNILGQEVRTLVDGPQGPGMHCVLWDGLDGSGQPVSTAVYFYRLQSGSFSMTKKMVLLR